MGATLGSAFAHLALVAWLVQGASEENVPLEPVEEPRVVAFNISAAPAGSASEVPQEEEAEAAAVAASSEDRVIDVPIPETVGDGAEAAPEGVDSPIGGEHYVWTPPPPKPIDRKERDRPIAKPAPVISLIKLPGERSDPVLVSFAPVKVDDVGIRSEVERLGGYGAMLMSVEVDDSGLPLGCTIVETSGSNLLDTQGCLVVLGYRYEPARDERGRATYGSASEYLEWGESAQLGGNGGSIGLASTG